MGNQHELNAWTLYPRFGLLRFSFFLSSLWLLLQITGAKISSSKVA